nr:lysozyme [Pseudomonas sp. s4]
MLRKQIAAASITAAIAVATPVVMYFEGNEPSAYLDPIGIPTVCYGHTKTAKLGQKKTDSECRLLLEKDLEIALSEVDRLVKVELPAERRAALTSFVYNVGSARFAKSTMLRKLNAGDTAGSCEELSRWVYADGKQWAGLIKRRAEERRLCEIGL